MFPISSTNPSLDQLFEAPEIHPDARKEPPLHALVRACLLGELPPGSLPPLAGEQKRPGVSRDQLIFDLEQVVSHFSERRQDTSGLGGLLCFCASELRHELQSNPRVDAADASRVLATARGLSRCLDVRKEWAGIHQLLERKMVASGDALLVPRWQRLNDLSMNFVCEADDSGIDPTTCGVLRREHVNALCERSASLKRTTRDMLATANGFSSLADIWWPYNPELRAALSQYEDIVAETLRRAALHGDPAAEAAVKHHVAAYDGKRPEVLRFDGQISAMRDALLGARTSAGGSGTTRQQLPVTMIALPRPSSCSSLSSSDNEGVPDPRVPVTGFTDLFERG